MQRAAVDSLLAFDGYRIAAETDILRSDEIETRHIHGSGRREMVESTSILDVLVVAPHPDDAELGMGGAILKMQASGLRVGVVDLTSGEPTPHGTLEIRAAETARATEILNLAWRRNLGLPNRSLVADLDARRAVAEVVRETRPKWLFAPYWVDAHPDHWAATELVEGGRFWAKLTKSDMSGEPHHPQRVFYYYCVHLKQAIQPAFIVDISEQWPTKRAAIEAYQSQFITGRPSKARSFVDRLEIEAAYWGQLIGVAYGEPYHCREPIGLSDFGSLV